MNGYRVRGISRSGQKKESAVPKKQVSTFNAEEGTGSFRKLLKKKKKKKKRIDLLLQWISPSKCKGLEEQRQKGKPETATAQSQEAVKNTSTMDSSAIEL